MTEIKTDKRKTIIWMAVLHAAFIIFSLSTVLSKLASGEDFLSVRFCCLYGGMIFLLALYSAVWQQVIKNVPLMIAYANKAVVVLWGLVWGVLIFGEQVTPGKIIGIVLVITGIVIFAISASDEEKESK